MPGPYLGLKNNIILNAYGPDVTHKIYPDKIRIVEVTNRNMCLNSLEHHRRDSLKVTKGFLESFHAVS